MYVFTHLYPYLFLCWYGFGAAELTDRLTGVSLCPTLPSADECWLETLHIHVTSVVATPVDTQLYNLRNSPQKFLYSEFVTHSKCHGADKKGIGFVADCSDTFIRPYLTFLCAKTTYQFLAETTTKYRADTLSYRNDLSPEFRTQILVL